MKAHQHVLPAVGVQLRRGVSSDDGDDATADGEVPDQAPPRRNVPPLLAHPPPRRPAEGGGQSVGPE